MTASCHHVLPRCISHLPTAVAARSITEKDIYGQDVSFESLRGKLVFLINVASEDGHSKDNYQVLQQLSTLRSDQFEIVIFPCNQFGEKEPRADRDVAFFARKHGFRGVVLAKGDVNGVNTRPAFRFLKAHSEKTHINGYFPLSLLCPAQHCLPMRGVVYSTAVCC